MKTTINTASMQAPVVIVPGNAEEHPADEEQGRGLDHLATGRTLSDVLVDAMMLPLIALGWLVAGNPSGRHQAEKLADYLLATAIALALAWGAVEYFTT